MKPLPVPCVCPEGLLPSYQSEGSAGADLHANIPEELHIAPGEHRSIPTGLRLEIPRGFEAQVRPRSGLALRHGVTLLNAPGTIDSDFRGEVCVLLVNLGREPFTVRPRDRIAQLVFAPVARAVFQPATGVADSRRGEGGFGSTGV
jgi:dUTP pyrophosphatase